VRTQRTWRTELRCFEKKAIDVIRGEDEWHSAFLAVAKNSLWRDFMTRILYLDVASESSDCIETVITLTQ
jgi:hypothetical protein